MGFFSRITGKGKPQAAPLPKTNYATANRIKNILGIRELESMPIQAARAFQLASDPKSNSSDFVKIIEQDEALGAKIIRVANSVYFFRGTKATDIEKAVANIGLDELRCLLTASMLKNLLTSKHPLRKQIWANSVAVAIACRTLSQYTDAISSSEAFLAGLVHDVGKLVILRKHGHLYEKVVARVSSGDLTFIEAEEEFFETNHVETGKWVAESWSFPDAAIKAIAQHHDPWPKDQNAQKRNTSIAMIVKAADTIAHAKGIGHPTAFRGFQRANEDHLKNVYAQLEIAPDAAANLISNFVKQFEEESGMFELEN